MKLINVYLYLQDSLKKMRQLDDKIIYLLNTTIPTESFKSQIDPSNKCKDLFQQIQSGHVQREIAIKKCINTVRDKVKEMKEKRDQNSNDDVNFVKNLRKEQNKLRLLESELNVEEVIKKRTTKVYYEKCRGYYKPDNNL